VKASCRETAFVRLVAHDLAGSAPTAQLEANLPVDQIVRSVLGAVALGPGQSTKIPITAGQRSRTTTVQVHVETERLIPDAAPCINVGGTVLRDNGNTQAVIHAQFANDFSILRPNSESVCIGSADCDQLLTLCEQSSDCSFTCHIAIRNPDGQACVFGSTD
jgi:hypothetical protein